MATAFTTLFRGGVHHNTQTRALWLLCVYLLGCSTAPAPPPAAAAAAAAPVAIGSCVAAAAAAAGAGRSYAARSNLEAGGLFDPRYAPGLARWYIPDDLPDMWIKDHEHPPVSFQEAYGSYVYGPHGLQFYDSHWVRFFYQWVYQMKSSPLRVHSPEAADFIFVPVCLPAFCGRPTNPLHFKSSEYHWTHSKTQDRKNHFFSNAHKMLPWLDKKPHVIAYNAAMGPDVAGHVGNFTFIGLERRAEMDKAHFITAPYPSHEHHDIYEPLPSLESLLQQKQKLAVGIYVVRKAITDRASIRTVLHRSCTEHPGTCTHVTWDMTHNMSFKAEAYSKYSTHHYCLQPPGDWLLRGAFYDCVVAGGMPAVFHADYAKHVAFADVFNYTQMLLQMPTPDELTASDGDYLEHLQQQHADSNSTAKYLAWQPLRRIYQYALNPNHYLVRWSERNSIDPRDDAFTFSLKALLRGLCSQKAFSKSPQCQLHASVTACPAVA